MARLVFVRGRADYTSAGVEVGPDARGTSTERSDAPVSPDSATLHGDVAWLLTPAVAPLGDVIEGLARISWRAACRSIGW